MLQCELTSDENIVHVYGKTTQLQHTLKPYTHKHNHWLLPTHVALKHAKRIQMPEYMQRLLAAKHNMLEPGPRPNNIPNHTWDKLFQYQKNTVSTVVNRFKGRCMLAHDMGLGKTVQAIALMQHYGSPVLVLCPAFLKDNWAQEIHKWAPDIQAHIQSYDSLRNHPPLTQPWKLVVADEAHYIKQKDAQRTIAAMPVLMECNHAVLLSGTPCPNRPEELFVPLHVLRPNIVRNFNTFAIRYCNARKTKFSNFDTTGATRKHELAWLLKRAFMIRLRKKDVLQELPPKICNTVHIHTTHTKAIADIATLREEMEDANPHRIKFIVTEMFRKTCQAKMTQAVQYVVQRAMQGPVVAFAHHRAMLDALQEHAHKHKLTTARIDGHTNMQNRQHTVDKIQQGDAVDVACLSMAAAGVGFTITAMSRVVFMELPWNPAVLHQCEDRVYRIGQQNTCYIEYLICKDTLDTQLWNKILRKESLVDILI